MDIPIPTDIPDGLSDLDDFLAWRESSDDLKPGAEAQIVWQPEKRDQQTEYAVIYLHGFRASHPEGNPVHRKIADFLGANLFLSRLQEHGIKSDLPLQNLTEEKLLASARFALAIGKKIGKKIWIMGTSTGGALALYLAAQPSFRKNIAGLILYSPLIRFFGIKEKLLQYSLSRKILSCVPGKTYRMEVPHTTFAEDKIWNSTYALQGALALGAFVDHQMHSELFERIDCPVFTGYYYKNRHEQDDVVSVHAIRDMATQLNGKTQLTNFPHAQTHVICSSLVSKSVQEVIQETRNFLQSVGLHQNNATTSN